MLIDSFLPLNEIMNHFPLSKTGAHSGKVTEQRNNVTAEFVLGDLRLRCGGGAEDSNLLEYCIVSSSDSTTV